jgi:hypothetical protein
MVLNKGALVGKVTLAQDSQGPSAAAEKAKAQH